MDVNRSQVQALTEQQRLVSRKRSRQAKDQSRAPHRLAGDRPVRSLRQYALFRRASALTLDDALKQALDQRSDLKAAEAQVRAAERARSAARARTPPVAFLERGLRRHRHQSVASARHLHGRRHPARAHLAGRTHRRRYRRGRRRAEPTPRRTGRPQRPRSRPRSATPTLDLQAAASQVEVAREIWKSAAKRCDLTRQRFEAGVADSVEVVQTEQAVATAELDYINSVFAHNVAKLSLARAVGGAAANLEQFLKLP